MSITQLASRRQFAEQPADMGDNAGVWGPERYTFEMTNLKN